MTLIFIKLLLSSCLLMAFYWAFLRNKASYDVSRIYLLSLPVVCLLMSCLSFEVYKAEVQEYPNFSPREAFVTPVVETVNEFDHDVELMSYQSPVAYSADNADTSSWTIADIDWMKAVRYGVPAVSALLLLMALFYVIKLFVIKSRMTSDRQQDGIVVIRSSSVKTPFSFAKTIFCPIDLEQSREILIMRHERAHIAHCHYIDVWAMEFMSRLMWFNPVVWMCRTELRNVHEFQADRDVIDGGAEIFSYQTILLEMVLNENCPVVNGFSHSFIRRRFIEMRNSTAGSLGRIGQASIIVFAMALFCLFTFEECAPDNGSQKVRLDIDSPQKFVLEGFVDPDISDSCYLLYLADEYLHFADTPAVCIPVVDKKFHYEADLTRLSCAYIRCIFPGGEVCGNSISFFMAPGETLRLFVHNGTYSNEYSTGFLPKINRGVELLRKHTDFDSPHQPKFDCSAWHNPSFSGGHGLIVRDVYFDTDETVVRLISNNHLGDFVIPHNCRLKDDDGNLYSLRRAVTGVVDGNNNVESRVFGVCLAFDGLPSDVKSFDIVYCIDNNEAQSTVMIGMMNGVKPASSENAGKTNFSLTIASTYGTDNSGYLISDHESHAFVADIENNDDRMASHSAFVDDLCLMDVSAVSPAGQISSQAMIIPFVPGEKADLKAMNGSFRLSGTGFYKEWSDANDAVDNLMQATSDDEVDDKLLTYLRANNSRLGCQLFFLINMIDVVPMADILGALPERCHPYVNKVRSAYLRGQRTQRQVEAERNILQRYSRVGMSFRDLEVECDGQMQRLSDYVGHGDYVLASFWASWSDVSLQTMPDIIDIHNKYKNKGLKVLGVASWDKPEDSRKAVNQLGISFPQIYNALNRSRDVYGVVSVPEFILFGPDGTIAARAVSVSDVESVIVKCLN